MLVLCTSQKATPVFGMTPNRSGIGDNWLPGLWMVWAERDIDSRRWVYCYSDNENSFLHSGQGISPSTFQTKRDALQAGIRYIKLIYKGETAASMAPAQFLAVPGPFKTA